MRQILLVCAITLAFGTLSVFGQGGGKAEPLRIKFAKGLSGTTLTGTLSNGQEMEYVFGAKKGQVVTIRNSTMSQFDFRIFSQENDVETEYDSSRTMVFEIPEDGDYMFFVRKKAAMPRSSRFSLSFSIK